MEIKGETFLSKAIATKFRLLGPLGKLHNIITYSQSIAAFQLEFKELINRRLVPLNNCTRWNSWHICLLVALLFMGAVNTFTKAHFKKLKKDYINPRE